MNIAPILSTTGTRVEGFAKSGTIPGGGCPASVVSSTVGGRLSMSFGSTLSDAMIQGALATMLNPRTATMTSFWDDGNYLHYVGESRSTSRAYIA